MRSVLGAVAVVVLAVLLLARTVSAGPPMVRPPRPMSEVIAEARKRPAAKAQWAGARFCLEVFGITSLEGNASPEAMVEQQLDQRSCGALTPAELKAATALLTEFGNELPPTMRAHTLAQQGKGEEAADVLAGFIDQLTSPIAKACPAEHPDTSGARMRRVGTALRCMKVYAPKRDLSPQLQRAGEARMCVKTNNTVG